MPKRGLVSLAGTAVIASQALGGQSVINTPLDGTIGSPFTEAGVHGTSFNFSGGQLLGTAGNLYDGLPTFLGGAATGGSRGLFGSVFGTFAFVDWNAPGAQWGDALGISASGGGPAIVTQLRYAYMNTLATSTHVIRIYDLVSLGDVPPITSFVEKDALLASIALPGQPSGTNVATITGLSIALPHSSVWMKLGESGPGFPGTLWLTGGGNGVGFSPLGLMLSDQTATPDPYQVWVPYQWFYFSTTGYVKANLAVAMSGIRVPAPPVIALLGVGGVIAMRRRAPRGQTPKGSAL